MGTVYAGEKIILPRNVHKSAINALILSGAVPVFVEPEYDKELGIANGVRVEEYVRAMDENPDAVAIFVINPTYFGVASNLKEIVYEESFCISDGCIVRNRFGVCQAVSQERL
jgi:lysine decarboxylase